jgi:hypothetical protein
VVAPAALEAEEACRFPVREAAEEGLIGADQTGQHILEHLEHWEYWEHMAVEGGVHWVGSAQLLEFGFLLEAGGAFALSMPPPGGVVLQSDVLENATAFEHYIERSLLVRCRLEFVGEPLADGARCEPVNACLLHGASLPGTRPPGQGRWTGTAGYSRQTPRGLTARPHGATACGELQPFSVSVYA